MQAKFLSLHSVIEIEIHTTYHPATCSISCDYLVSFSPLCFFSLRISEPARKVVNYELALPRNIESVMSSSGFQCTYHGNNVNTCRPCPLGTYQVNQECIPCPAGETNDISAAPSTRIRIFFNPQLFLSGYENIRVHTLSDRSVFISNSPVHTYSDSPRIH